MKQFLIHLLLLLLTGGKAAGQNDFTGIAKYRISTEGKANANTDSMTVIFDKQRVKVILYITEPGNTKKVSEMIFIDDLKDKKTITVNTAKKTYKIDSLNMTTNYRFIDTWKIEASTSNTLCYRYRADSTKLDSSEILKVDCLGSLENLNTLINEYFFLGVQPIIIDNRIVMEFVISKTDGTKERTSVLEITRTDNVKNYFDLKDYKLVK
jgi:hypothetical protein